MQTGNFTIRDAREGDIPQLSELITQLGYPCTPEEVSVRFRNISQHPDHRTLVIEDGGTLAGMTGIMKGFWVEKNGIYVRILAFVINADYRGQGVGKILLKAVEDWAHQVDANSVIVNSGNREERVGAHHFYRSCGFELKSSGFIKVY